MPGVDKGSVRVSPDLLRFGLLRDQRLRRAPALRGAYVKGYADRDGDERAQPVTAMVANDTRRRGMPATLGRAAPERIDLDQTALASVS
jgi:hypothetical protein